MDKGVWPFNIVRGSDPLSHSRRRYLNDTVRPFV